MRQIPFLVVLAVGLTVVAVQAEELPRWELGLGIADLNIPDYRGSDQRRNYLLPLPYVQYRGDVFRIDREGAHGDVFTTKHVKLDISLNAGPPAKSGKSDARNGMPDIDPTVEVGPSAQIFLAHDHRWLLRFPMRAVAATNFSHVRYIGWVFAPSLNFDVRRFGGGWGFSAAAGPLYASEDYHDYYYEVVPAYATASRPTYDAPAGYSGSRLTLAVSRRFPRFWVGAFARYDNLSGAVFADSPLVKEKESFMAGIGIAWVLMESRQP